MLGRAVDRVPFNRLQLRFVLREVARARLLLQLADALDPRRRRQLRDNVLDRAFDDMTLGVHAPHPPQ